MLKTKSGKSIKSASDLQSVNALKKEFERNKDLEVKVGFPAESSDTISTEEGVTALFKATVNNYGLGVPKRPFMGVAFASNVGKYQKMIKKQLFKVPIAKIFAQIGSIGEGDVKRAIIAMKSPPNSAATIARKGGDDNPLIDTGHMVGAVSHAVVKRA